MKVNTRDARKRLSELLDRVEAGEEITITRHGNAVARMIRAREPNKTLPGLGSLRRSLRLEGEPVSETVRKMREEHRY